MKKLLKNVVKRIKRIQNINVIDISKEIDMAPKKTEIRLNNIIRVLRDQNGASIKQLADMFNVTEMTVRRDLKGLQECGLVTVIHGAAIYNPNAEDNMHRPYTLTKSSPVMKDEKSRIGKAAAQLIEPQDILFIDSGTTTTQLVRNLPVGMDITLNCFAYNIFSEAKSRCIDKLCLGGGLFHPDTETFESPETLDMVANTRATKAFIVPNAIEKNLGFMCVQEYEMNLKRSFVANSMSRIVLADSSKFGKVTQCFICNFSDVDVIVTDDGLSQDWITFLKKKNIELIIV